MDSRFNIVVSPDCVFVQLAVGCLHVDLADILHLKTLFEALEFFEVFALEHFADQVPMQVVLLE